jgi:hypothetical protein
MTRRPDVAALLTGLVLTAAAVLFLSGRPVRVDASWMVPAALLGLATWLIASALRARRESG